VDRQDYHLDSHIEIKLGMPEELRHQAAIVCYEGFRSQMELLVGSQQKSIALLEHSMDAELALMALQKGQLVGLVGLQYENRPFFQFERSQFIKELGFLRGLLVYLLFNLSATQIQSDEIFVNVIVVDAAMRGIGIGTSLMQAVFEIARQNQFHAVVLDVIDTNPDAQRLYERLGFEQVHIRKYGYLRNLIGSSSITTMRKDVISSQ
jgi:ribosomal protein S18 acetylase RimI-like enzyme